MKILFVSPVGALFSGAEVSIVNLMKFLTQKGYEIHNVIPDNEYPDPEYLKIMEESGIHLHFIKTIHWWWKESSQESQMNSNAITAYHQQHVGEIRQLLKQEKIDLVISNTVNVFQGAIAAACENLPHYYIIHEFPYGEFGYYKEKIELINQLSDKIFAVKGELFQTLLEYFPAEKLLPFVPYSDVKLIDLPSSDTVRLISIGGISERKNQLELIKAYHLLNKSDIELVFIGAWDEEYKKLCDRYIEDHQLKNITFLGYQTDPWHYITDHDVMVLPSQLETFSLVFVEAILNGVPTIVSNNPGHLSSSKYFNVHYFYELGNIEQLAECIEDRLSRFELFKTEAVAKKGEARALYTLSTTSRLFLEQIENMTHTEEAVKLSDIQSLIGWQTSSDILELIEGNHIEVLFSDDNQHYEPVPDLKRILLSRDSFSIQIQSASYLKIQLSKFPGAYSQLSLQEKQSAQVLPIDSLNGKQLENSIMFIEKNPYIIYDIRDYSHKEFVFTYTKVPLGNYLDSLKHLHDVEEKYASLLYDYNCIITSRRWKLATKLVNLFKKRK